MLYRKGGGLESPFHAFHCDSQSSFCSLAGPCRCDLPRFKASRSLSLWALTPVTGRGASPRFQSRSDQHMTLMFLIKVVIFGV